LLFFRFTGRFRWQRWEFQQRHRRLHYRRTDDIRRYRNSHGRLDRLGWGHDGDRRHHCYGRDPAHGRCDADRRKRLGRCHLDRRYQQHGWNRQHGRQPQDRRNEQHGWNRGHGRHDRHGRQFGDRG
jgi:hypothetical protein